MSAYYDTVRYPSAFHQRAKEHVNFASLAQSPGFQSGASNWDIRHLFASRVICTAPVWRLSFLDDFFPRRMDEELHPCLHALIQSPLPQFSQLWEPQIVQLYQPDSLGYVWAALSSFLRAESTHTVAHFEDTEEGLPSTPERPRRERTQIVHDNFVPSDSFVIGSSSPNRPLTSSSGSEHSIGYRGNASVLLLEDATVRLASSFIRCVVNYAQPTNKTGPFVHFRDARLTHRYETSPGNMIEAVDDGGLQILGANGEMFQVALLEGKRAFQVAIEGKPIVTDGLLAQLVGEALALRQSDTSSALSDE